jgi:hypothetical protein
MVSMLRVQGWPEKALLECYVGGLREEIWIEVKLFCPTTLLHAINLACLQEKKLNIQRRALTRLPLLPTHCHDKLQVLFNTNQPTTSINLKRLTWGEM